MSELPQFEKRITAAFERIRGGLDGLNAPAAAPVAQDGELSAQVAQLSAQLNEERTANAQLEERVKVLKERQDGKMTELEAGIETGRARSARMDRELQRLREVNAELRDINTQLRKALTQNVSEPHLVNKAMLAELDALRATRTADVAEMDAILQELTPIIEKGARDATS